MTTGKNNLNSEKENKANLPIIKSEKVKSVKPSWRQPIPLAKVEGWKFHDTNFKTTIDGQAMRLKDEPPGENERPSASQCRRYWCYPVSEEEAQRMAATQILVVSPPAAPSEPPPPPLSLFASGFFHTVAKSEASTNWQFEPVEFTVINGGSKLVKDEAKPIEEKNKSPVAKQSHPFWNTPAPRERVQVFAARQSTLPSSSQVSATVASSNADVMPSQQNIPFETTSKTWIELTDLISSNCGASFSPLRR